MSAAAWQDIDPHWFMWASSQSWWQFNAVDEAEAEYGWDESCPWFEWRLRSDISLPDGSSRWVDVPEPYIARNRYDNRDAICGTSYTLLPASQRYALRLQRWQNLRELSRPIHGCEWIGEEPF